MKLQASDLGITGIPDVIPKEFHRYVQSAIDNSRLWIERKVMPIQSLDPTLLLLPEGHNTPLFLPLNFDTKALKQTSFTLTALYAALVKARLVICVMEAWTAVGQQQVEGKTVMPSEREDRRDTLLINVIVPDWKNRPNIQFGIFPVVPALDGGRTMKGGTWTSMPEDGMLGPLLYTMYGGGPAKLFEEAAEDDHV